MLDVEGPDGMRQVRVSSPDRVIFPDDGITKEDLARYLVTVGEAFIRANGNRPIALQRFPEGIDGEQFFSKNPPRGVPDYVRLVTCTYPSGRKHPQLVLDEPAAAVWCAQMNTVTFHPWPVTADDNDRPDEFRIDLDPQPGRAFADVVEAAYALREVMTEIGFEPRVKTSGNRGLHVYASIEPTHEFLDVRHGVIGVARELERRQPDLVTTAWWKEERGERIFVDFNQACRDRTIAGAYSPRPLPGAPVSMPLPWDRLRDAKPGDFTVRTVPGLLASDGDAWADRGAKGDITAAIALWDKDVAERGLGELNFPPDYPKMPGEPPRVQPSKKVAGHWDDEGNRIDAG
ncbi:non-homologous end-joining DNA ligase [Calidifontibacter terrae]